MQAQNSTHHDEVCRGWVAKIKDVVRRVHTKVQSAVTEMDVTDLEVELCVRRMDDSKSGKLTIWMLLRDNVFL